MKTCRYQIIHHNQGNIAILQGAIEKKTSNEVLLMHLLSLLDNQHPNCYITTTTTTTVIYDTLNIMKLANYEIIILSTGISHHCDLAFMYYLE